MTWAISILLLAIYGYLCSRTVRKGLLVFVGALPLYLVRLDIGPIPTNLLELMFVVLVLTWGLGFLQERRRDSLRKLVTDHKWVFIGIGLILLGSLLGLTQTSDVLGSLNIIKSYLIEPILLGAIIWSVSRSSENFKIREFLTALSIPVIALSIVAIFQFITGLTIPETWATEGRVTSLYPYPNALGHFIAPIITVIAVYFADGKSRMNRAQRWSLVSALILGTIAIILAQTEAAIGAILVSMFLVSLLYRRGIKYTMPIALGTIAVVLLVPMLRNPVIEKVTLQDWSGQTRIAQWKETAHFLTDNPVNFLLGAGPDNYPVAIEPFHTHTHLEIFQYPHNIVLNTWVEFGLLGLAGSALTGYGIWLVATRRSNRYHVIPFAAGLTEMVIHGVVDVPFLKNDLVMLGSVFVALLLIAAQREKAFKPKRLPF